MSAPQRRSFISRKFDCPRCGREITIPKLWIMGVESVFICPKCRLRFKTGYKVGAILFALSLTAAIVTANLGAWLFSSVTIPIMAALIVPFWLFYGFLLRRWCMFIKARKAVNKPEDQ